MNIVDLTSADLARIAKLLKQKKSLAARIDRINRELSAFESATTKAKPVRKRKISAAGRARIAAAQRARWAKLKALKTK